MNKHEVVFDGDMRPLPQDPDAPLRGVTDDGQECRCDCHEAPNVFHVSVCCRIEAIEPEEESDPQSADVPR